MSNFRGPNTSAGFQIDYKFNGVERLMKRLNGVVQNIEKELKEAMTEEGKDVIRLAKVYVPIETEELKKSGRSQTYRTGTIVRLRLSFGGKPGTGNVDETNAENVYYAAVVHEDPNYRHGAALIPPKDHNQQWKYLERAVNESEGSFVAQLTARLSRAIR